MGTNGKDCHRQDAEPDIRDEGPNHIDVVMVTFNFLGPSTREDCLPPKEKGP
jgi:hypothetical protein